MTLEQEIRKVLADNPHSIVMDEPGLCSKCDEMVRDLAVRTERSWREKGYAAAIAAFVGGEG